MNETGSRHFNVGYRKNLQHIMSVEDSASEVLEYIMLMHFLCRNKHQARATCLCERLAVVF